MLGKCAQRMGFGDTEPVNLQKPEKILSLIIVMGVALEGAGGNCIKISLPGKLILSKRKGLREVLFS